MYTLLELGVGLAYLVDFLVIHCRIDILREASMASCSWVDLFRFITYELQIRYLFAYNILIKPFVLMKFNSLLILQNIVHAAVNLGDYPIDQAKI